MGCYSELLEMIASCGNQTTKSTASVEIFVFLGVGGRRQDSIQAQIHSGGAVVVRPAASQKKYRHGSRSLYATEVNIVAQVGVVDFGEGFGAEIERGSGGGEELVFGI